jgi:hypothetical protein
MPVMSAHHVIGRRGDLREAAVRLDLLVNGGYRLVAHSNAGRAARVWVHLEGGEYRELVPGRAVPLPREHRSRSQREVRYLTDGSSSSAELPVRFELVLDPTI